jgi:hypothetical protein
MSFFWEKILRMLPQCQLYEWHTRQKQDFKCCKPLIGENPRMQKKKQLNCFVFYKLMGADGMS